MFEEATPDGIRLVTDSIFAVDVTVGHSHGCILSAGGFVYCWGANYDGQLGDGTVLPSDIPVQVPGIADVVSIDSELELTCAVTQDGATFCWGTGFLGNGWKTYHCEPQKVQSDFGM